MIIKEVLYLAGKTVRIQTLGIIIIVSNFTISQNQKSHQKSVAEVQAWAINTQKNITRSCNRIDVQKLFFDRQIKKSYSEPGVKAALLKSRFALFWA